MKIVRTLAEEDCPNGIECAKVHVLDDGRILVRGYRAPAEFVAELGLPAHEDVVVMPAYVWKESHQ